MKKQIGFTTSHKSTFMTLVMMVSYTFFAFSLGGCGKYLTKKDAKSRSEYFAYAAKSYEAQGQDAYNKAEQEEQTGQKVQEENGVTLDIKSRYQLAKWSFKQAISNYHAVITMDETHHSNKKLAEEARRSILPLQMQLEIIEQKLANLDPNYKVNKTQTLNTTSDNTEVKR